MERSPKPDINIEPEYCPEAVIEWHRLTGLKDRKASACRRDLSLKAKQHLLFLGWKFWFINKICRWEMRYTDTNGKTFPSLKAACKSCIESGGCSLRQPSTAAAAAATTSISSSQSSQLQSKKRPRESEVTGEVDGVFPRKHPSLAAAAAAPPATSSFSFPLQSMNQPREYEETNENDFFSFKHPSFALQPATETSIFSSPLQSMNQPREYKEINENDGVNFLQHPSLAAAAAAAETSIFSFPFQSLMQPREYEETNEVNGDFYLTHPSTAAPPAAATSISWSPLQSKKQPESEETDEKGGCSLNQPSTATPAAALTTALISSPPLQSKEQPRESKETDESTSDEDSDDDSTSDEDSEPSNSSFDKKAPVTMVSTSKENEKNASQSESEVTNSVGSSERGKLLKMSVMEKNSESCNNRGKVIKTMENNNSENRRKRGMVLKREGVRERYSLVSWLIKNQVLVPGTDVFCRGSNNVVKRGSLFSDGIVCDCCHVNFTVTGFEAHAGCTRHRPSTSILLEDGRSLLECQREAQSSRDQTGNHCVAEANSEANNDNVCAICGFGGDIVLCDRCPSSFHLSCLGLDQVPDGDWFCPTCCCKICYGPKCKQECADHNDNNILACVQCEQKFHFGCVKAIGGYGPSDAESNAEKKDWFCSVVCGNMFLCLKKLLGKPITIADNITWTLLKNNASSDYDYDGGNFTSYEFSLNKRKLNSALGVLYQSFNPSIDAFSGRELIKDVVFSRDSKHNRLNFRGFYNVILEKMGEVVSVATIRIYGPKVAEVVFVATKEQHRKQGLCRLLMDELEKQLIRLGVGSFVLHSSEDAINTWTKSFGFVRMTGKDKCRFIDNTFLEFQNSIMCLKLLNRPTWPYIARS
ncbi:PHD finger transcription factor [Trifolium repens]|nr:PHD finger transcription factor [Trifolium repens]